MIKELVAGFEQTKRSALTAWVDKYGSVLAVLDDGLEILCQGHVCSVVETIFVNHGA